MLYRRGPTLWEKDRTRPPAQYSDLTLSRYHTQGPIPQCQVLYPYMKVITTYNDVASLQLLQWLFLCFWASQQVIAYCMIATLEIGFTAGFSALKWGMDQIPKTQNIWRIKSCAKKIKQSRNYFLLQTTNFCVLDILPSQIVLRVVCSKK